MARPLKHLIRAATASRRSRFVIVAAILVLSAMAIAVLGGSTRSSSASRLVNRQPAAATGGAAASFQAVRAAAHKLGRRVVVGHSVRNDTSRPLRLMKRGPRPTVHELEPLARPLSHRISRQAARAGGVVQDTPTASNMPSPSLTFEGMNMASACNCLPPDTDGEAGASQYVQIVNVAMQVFNKSGTSLLGPIPISTLWSGFGGVCETQDYGDPIVLYDQLAGRWVISQFNGPGGALPAGAPTDECIAVSTSSDATGSYNRYDFHLGSNFFDYPKLGVWPDAYYMSDIVFTADGNSYLGPQPFAFNRAAMLTGAASSFITTAGTLGGSEDPILPADVDGTAPPPAGAPEPFVEWPGNLTYKVYRFHVNWSSPSSSTFTLAGAPAAAAFSVLCSGTRSCVPQPGTAQGLDGIGDRFMARAAYRNYGGHESLVTNYTVVSGGVAGIRWIELRNLTSGAPTLAQQSTYQPDTTYRWMGSAAQDASGDLALGFSASSAATYPSIRWAGRLSSDPANVLSQGEATMFTGSGSQTHSAARWGDYSAMVADPADDCTFWYTQEYYGATSVASWQTRVGKFKFPNCALHTLTVTRAGTGSGTVTSNPAGVSCGSACTFTAGSATSVSLTPAAAAGSTFAGFSGDCSGSSCSLAMSANHSVTATFTTSAPPVQCIVPKVVGLTLSKAKGKIKKAHCRVGKVTKKHSSKKKKGKVIKQSPKAGKHLLAGTKVNLTVGKG
ncbi:MAG TPA: PASTA domain-containing protein [Gaiellaceae bacterium]|nr:PASTA domain-containing protein [Gaiellaceae bacterium]